MSWVICNTQTWKLYRGNSYSGKIYDEERVAKAQYTRLTKTKDDKKRLDPTVWHLMTYEDYRATEPMVERINLMSGKPFMVRASEAGTSMSPDSESYWSM